MKHKSQQLDIQWGEPEAFALAIQTTQDGDRIATGRTESAARKEESEKQQTTLV